MIEVTLGSVTVPVYPQKIGRFQKLPEALKDRLASADDTENTDVLEWLGGGAYEVLCVLLPQLETRMTRDEFLSDENGATIPEVRAAFSAVFEVNQLTDLPGLLGKALGPQMAAYLRSTALEQLMKGSTDSPTSPTENGESESTSSGTPLQTSTENTD